MVTLSRWESCSGCSDTELLILRFRQADIGQNDRYQINLVINSQLFLRLKLHCQLITFILTFYIHLYEVTHLSINLLVTILFLILCWKDLGASCSGCCYNLLMFVSLYKNSAMARPPPYKRQNCVLQFIHTIKRLSANTWHEI